MRKDKIKAFTLVELIIVITILAILATIGFMSYGSYTISARDWKRITDLWEIRKWLEIYRAKNSLLPNPDIKYVTIETSLWNTLSLQWYVWTTVLSQLKWSPDFKDPLNKENYTYIVNNAKTKYQLLTYLEENHSLISFMNFLNKTYSASNDYKTKFPYLIWDEIWWLTDWEKNPIQQVYTWTLNLSTYTWSLIIYENNKDAPISWTWWDILNALWTEPNSWSWCVFWSASFWSCSL